MSLQTYVSNPDEFVMAPAVTVPLSPKQFAFVWVHGAILNALGGETVNGVAEEVQGQSVVNTIV